MVRRVDRPIDRPPCGRPSATHQAVLIEQLGQERSEQRRAVRSTSILLGDAVAHRLAEQRVGVFLAGQVEQRPGPPGEDDPMDVDIVLDEVLEIVVGLAERSVCQGREGSFGAVHVLLSHRGAEEFGGIRGLRATGRPRRDGASRASGRRVC